MFPEGTVPESLLNDATIGISHYAVSFAVDVRPSGSATLVKLNDEFGFLTAAHVVDDIMRSDSPTVEVILSSRLHRVSIEKRFLRIVRFGPTDAELPGPDIAFLGLHDPMRIAALKAIKSFYPLTDQAAEVYEKIPQKFTAYCVVAGMPAEMASETGRRHAADHVWKMTLFFGRTQIIEEIAEGDFSYLRCAMWAGTNSFPSNYGGVSGGGIWHIPFLMEESNGVTKVSDLKPELVGVAFYQSGVEDQSRTLIAHSYRGLYRVLSEKRKSV